MWGSHPIGLSLRYFSGEEIHWSEYTFGAIQLVPTVHFGINAVGSYSKSLGIGFNSAAKGGVLADDVAKTFRFRKYTEVTLDKPIVLFRYYDNIEAFAKGRYMSNSPSSITFIDRMGPGIRPSWNAMTKIAYWEIPAGTTLYKGKAAMQFPWIGGKTQYFLPEIQYIKSVTQQ